MPALAHRAVQGGVVGPYLLQAQHIRLPLVQPDAIPRRWAARMPFTLTVATLSTAELLLLPRRESVQPEHDASAAQNVIRAPDIAPDGRLQA